MAAVAGAAAGALTAATAVALIRRHRRTAPDPRVAWTCACGQAYLVQGTDRHRIYWLPDAGREDPLLERECVECGAALP